MDYNSDIENEVDLSDADAAEIIDSLSEEDLHQASSSLDEAQTYWERMASLNQPKIACPECTGAGSISSGSLGSACPTCAGSRVVAHPDWDGVDGPDFKALRKAITTYGAALAERQLPAHATCGRCGGNGLGDGGTGTCEQCGGDGKIPHPGRRGLALPPASSVPTKGDIAAIMDQGRQLSASLAPAAMPELPAYAYPKGMESEHGNLDDYSDEDLDGFEDEDDGDAGL